MELVLTEVACIEGGPEHPKEEGSNHGKNNVSVTRLDRVERLVFFADHEAY